MGTNKKVKKNKSILLTTHAMEEADILSDRVVIISNGSIKCQDTASQLKHTYGGILIKNYFDFKLY